MEKKRDSFFLKKKQEAQTENAEAKKQKRQDDFSKNRNINEGKNPETLTKPEKKYFDKKLYRLKKYSNKYKLEQWEAHRKRKLLREYKKDVKNDPVAGTYKAKSFDQDEPDGSDDVGKYVRHPDLAEQVNSTTKIKKDPYRKAKEEYNKVKQDNRDRKQEIEKIKAEKRQKLEEYKKKKQDRFKKLSKKTKKGQPVMLGRLELLLDRINQIQTHQEN